ncbi:helix-turn-helix domain-containing protein [Nonomuraea longicatena]|uniref:HTH tetR-type domain-containing protein n=1 Tax=Nonomuraea longicatena TaxID=83682 RepID=A0ABN1QB73_9ACTN
MPKLWDDTIDAHRRAVREAVLDAAAALVAAHGLHGLTMSRVAEAAGIGRATLYKYFPDVGSILRAWHERHVEAHLAALAALAAGPGDVGERLTAVLTAYAGIEGARRDGDELHAGAHARGARERLRAFLRDLLAEGAAAGRVRTDVPPEELSAYCLHALSAAGELAPEAAGRLVAVVAAGLGVTH